jgi:hypothetical protein
LILQHHTKRKTKMTSDEILKLSISKFKFCRQNINIVNLSITDSLNSLQGIMLRMKIVFYILNLVHILDQLCQQKKQTLFFYWLIWVCKQKKLEKLCLLFMS